MFENSDPKSTSNDLKIRKCFEMSHLAKKKVPIRKAANMKEESGKRKLECGKDLPVMLLMHYFLKNVKQKPEAPGGNNQK